MCIYAQPIAESALVRCTTYFLFSKSDKIPLQQIWKTLLRHQRHAEDRSPPQRPFIYLSGFWLGLPTLQSQSKPTGRKRPGNIKNYMTTKAKENKISVLTMPLAQKENELNGSSAFVKEQKSHTILLQLNQVYYMSWEQQCL